MELQLLMQTLFKMETTHSLRTQLLSNVQVATLVSMAVKQSSASRIGNGMTQPFSAKGNLVVALIRTLTHRSQHILLFMRVLQTTPVMPVMNSLVEI